MPSFREVLFPVDLSYGSAGGPKFKTSVFTADSGIETRIKDWDTQKAEYDVSKQIQSEADVDTLMNFFHAVAKGKGYAFRFKDWNDHQILNEVIGTGDGNNKIFQIKKTYSFTQPNSATTTSYVRNIKKIAWNSLTGVKVAGVLVNPADYTLNENTGVITFTTAPALGAQVAVVAAEFHVPVRFGTDKLDLTHQHWKKQDWQQIPLIEDRDWNEVFSETAPAPTPNWVLALQAPSGDLPIIALDFANDQWWGSHAEQVVGDILFQDLAWGPFDTGSIVPGSGMSTTGNNSPLIVHSFLENLLTTGFTVLIRMKNALAADNVSWVELDAIDLPAYNTDIFVTLQVAGDAIDCVGKIFSNSTSAQDSTTYSTDVLGSAYNFNIGTQMAVSTNGDAVVTCGDTPPAIPLTDIGMYCHTNSGTVPVYMQLVAIYPPQANADLPAISLI